MADSRHEFVANELWMLVGVLTVALMVLAGMLGLEGLSGAISVLGFLLFAPLFLFWGEEIADLLFEPPESSDGEQAAGDETADDEADADPLEELKEQYALGHVDEREFEERLERLLALDEVDASDADLAALRGEPSASSGAAQTAEREGTARDEAAPERDAEREQ